MATNDIRRFNHFISFQLGFFGVQTLNHFNDG